MVDDHLGNGGAIRGEDEAHSDYLRDVLKYVVEIGASLRLQMDTETLLERIVNISCKALHFQYAVIYLSDGAGLFHVKAASHSINAMAQAYLKDHPLPASVVARIIDEQYRVSDSYFLPAEDPIWQDQELTSYFVTVNPATSTHEPVSLPPVSSLNSRAWNPDDLVLVPLLSGDNQLLGFLTPDSPLSGLRPTRETMGLFELFANQAAVVIEGARLSGELREALRQARESEQVKNNFLLTASHELRTPLTAVQGYLELLSDYWDTLDDVSRARFIQNARRGCDELVLLLGNVLDATHLDIEKVSFKCGPVDLEHSVQLILEILEPIIAREKRQVRLQLSGELLVWADELRLRQVLLNLLGNALKYTPTGSCLEIFSEHIDARRLRELSADGSAETASDDVRSGTFVVLALRDWGPGIALAEQPALFTKFTRLESARNSAQHGVGLGLYLCRQLIEAMGGRIWMRSSGLPGDGATFFVALPSYEP